MKLATLFMSPSQTTKWLKQNYPHIRIRINTNGQSNLIENRDITPEFEGVIDAISINLNAPNPYTYDSLCKSIFGTAAFWTILDFAKCGCSFKALEYI